MIVSLRGHSLLFLDPNEHRDVFPSGTLNIFHQYLGLAVAFACLLFAIIDPSIL